VDESHCQQHEVGLDHLAPTGVVELSRAGSRIDRPFDLFCLRSDDRAVFTSKFTGYFLNSLIRGAIFMASGRVPYINNIFFICYILAIAFLPEIPRPSALRPVSVL
jgi:hypothetical protein